MNPYLENPQLWPEVHSRLMIGIADFLNSQVMPKYRVAVERRIYEILDGESLSVGIPDVAVLDPVRSQPEVIPATAPQKLSGTSTITQPRRIRLPMPEEVRESYLEIRDVTTGLVITVIELLSPKNKQTGMGRDLYQTKRLRILGSPVNLVEIDLLRAGRAMVQCDLELLPYSVVVSVARNRPEAEWYGFGLRDTLPIFWIPLRLASEVVVLDLQQVFQETYDRAGFDLAVDYDQLPPPPKLSEADQVWIKELLQS